MKVDMVEKHPIKDLIEQAQGGDRAAFGELFELHRSRLAGLIHSKIGPWMRGKLDVDDVLQETFTRALQSLDRFLWRGDQSFIRWLGGIAENLILDAARAQRRTQKFHLLREAPGSGTSPSGAMRREERFERLQEALDRLTPEQREVIRLLRIEGLKIAEVSERLKKSPDAVKQLMLRGLKRLRGDVRESRTLHLPDRPLDFGGDGDV